MVEYIEIPGRGTYPVRLGYYVMKNLKAETGFSFAEAIKETQENHNIEVHETILYYALKMGAFAEGTEMDIDKEEIPMVLDLCFYDYMKLFQSEKFFPRKDQMNSQDEGNTEKKTKPQRTKTKGKTSTDSAVSR